MSEPTQTSSKRRMVVIAVGVFTSGAVLLGVELAASRVLAPFFGNSLFVWGALIGVVLTGLMLGYWLGGVAVDRLPAEWLLVSTMALGALGVLLIPLIDGPILEFVVEWDPGPRLNPLIASTLLFGPASVLLAATTPIAVRLVARSLATVGRTSGGLFSISTAGSIVGTYLTAFLLIPELGTDQVLTVAATVLGIACAGIAVSERLWPAVVAALVLVVAGLGSTAALDPDQSRRLSTIETTNWSPVYRQRQRPDETIERASRALDAVYARDTEYHRVLVTEDGSNRYLRFDSSFQSGMRIDDPYATVFPYTDAMHVGLAYRPQAKRVLFIGLGGGSIPKRVWRDFPDVQMDVVEIDGEVVNVARKFFAFPDDPRVEVHVKDGRRFLQTTDERYDLIMVDAFYSDSVPAHLTTREFVALAREHLAPGGAVVSNVIGALNGEQSRLFRAMYRTQRSEFATVAVHPVGDAPGAGDDKEVRNLIVVATDEPVTGRDVLRARWSALRRDHPAAPDLDATIDTRYEALVPVGDVPTLTDDYAPTDALILVF
jgi:spermidine synthase